VGMEKLIRMIDMDFAARWAKKKVPGWFDIKKPAIAMNGEAKGANANGEETKEQPPQQNGSLNDPLYSQRAKRNSVTWRFSRAT